MLAADITDAAADEAAAAKAEAKKLGAKLMTAAGKKDGDKWVVTMVRRLKATQ